MASSCPGLPSRPRARRGAGLLEGRKGAAGGAFNAQRLPEGRVRTPAPGLQPAFFFLVLLQPTRHRPRPGKFPTSPGPAGAAPCLKQCQGTPRCRASILRTLACRYLVERNTAGTGLLQRHESANSSHDSRTSVHWRFACCFDVYQCIHCCCPQVALLQQLKRCSVAAARAVRHSRQLTHEHCTASRAVRYQAFRARALRRAQAVMGKKRRAFDDDADESEEDEISRHAEAAWLARRRAQQPAPPPPAAEPPRGPGPRTQGKGKPPKKKRKKPEPPAEAAEPAQPKRSKSARKRAAAAAARERKAKAVKAEQKAKRKEKWRQEGIKNKKAAGGRVHRQTEKHGESRWGKKDGEDAPKKS